jgi:hypothetical protein
MIRAAALVVMLTATAARGAGGLPMADLTTDFLGIKSPNPFWLASAPPTDKEYNVVRAFKAAGAASSGRRWARKARPS